MQFLLSHSFVSVDFMPFKLLQANHFSVVVAAHVADICMQLICAKKSPLKMVIDVNGHI